MLCHKFSYHKSQLQCAATQPSCYFRCFKLENKMCKGSQSYFRTTVPLGPEKTQGCNIYAQPLSFTGNTNIQTILCPLSWGHESTPALFYLAILMYSSFLDYNTGKAGKPARPPQPPHSPLAGGWTEFLSSLSTMQRGSRQRN